MTNINFILSTAHFVISLLDVKQQLLTGTKHSNTFFPSDRRSSSNSREQLSRSSSSQLSRSAKEIHDSRQCVPNSKIFLDTKLVIKWVKILTQLFDIFVTTLIPGVTTLIPCWPQTPPTRGCWGWWTGQAGPWSPPAIMWPGGAIHTPSPCITPEVGTIHVLSFYKV